MANYGSILEEVVGRVGKRGGNPRLTRSTKGEWYDTNMFGNGFIKITDPKEMAICTEICAISKKKTHTENDKFRVKALYDTLVALHTNGKIDTIINVNANIDTNSNNNVAPKVVDTPPTRNRVVNKYGTTYELFAYASLSDTEKQERGNIANRIDNFFKEFDFTNATSYRFLNTLGLKAKKSMKCATEYVKAQMTLLDLPSKNGCIDKMKSDEWKSILRDLATLHTTQIVNNRFMVLFGPAGTGKTTKVLNDHPGIIKFNCNPSMIASDMMEDFKLKDSVSNLALSSIVKCAIEGKEILLDEMGALTYDCLETLQTLLDNTNEFEWKGQKITIKDGFKVIGTMNLMVNGRVFTLPEPLLDRAEDLIEYVPTYDMLGMAF